MNFITVKARFQDRSIGETCISLSSISHFYDINDCSYIILTNGILIQTENKISNKLRKFINKTNKITRIEDVSL